MTQIEFLHARVDEDQTRANAMRHFIVHEQPYYSCAGARTGPVGDLEWGEEHCDCFLAERKGRALREVAAKRAILAQWEAMPPESLVLTFVLSALTAVYSDHPDYQPEWGPS